MRKPTKKQRFETYKRVLEILENKEIVCGGLGDADTDGLCMYLYCVFYNLNWNNCGVDWNKTPEIFPEFGELYHKSNTITIDNEWRIKTLKTILNK